MPRIRDEIRSILARDPAARSARDVALTYPGFHAIRLHRLAHRLWRRGWKLTAKFVATFSRIQTGIEIHPAAIIGEFCFIDHGMGVVIGETAVIGDRCTLYQGVTLGGISTSKTKRHPTLGNDVVVGAGAKLLGPITVGDGAHIGANAVVLKDVASGETAVGIPARPRPPEGAPDSATLLERVAEIEARLMEFELAMNLVRRQNNPNFDA